MLNIRSTAQSVPANAAGVSIHSACHIARPDAHAICHAHSLYGKAWASFGRELDMISQDVCYFYKAHSVYRNYGGIAFGQDEGTNIARALGNNKAAILVNHGLITVGETVDEAAYLYTLLEKSCRIQLMVEAIGLPKVIVPDDEAMDTFQMASQPVSRDRTRRSRCTADYTSRKHCLSSFNRATNSKSISTLTSRTEWLMEQIC
jgi:ribulose-5-phosphate 4-epimerase/fuculose-1-phosphate aldolase